MSKTQTTLEVYKVKISGTDSSFIDDIIATLSNAYKCYNVSRHIPNTGSPGVHQFVDILRDKP